ncbi:aspartyl-phosphate phosphatase Spo0E family protein [Mesobacillus zeae]|uniref:Aspartyl-phosphate phosphatase Spo0E family protein n=1 Tax=Mesobacillus zeae TaxID=1917180 RepID=A0A398BES2_9BACI|nr:aspartyl-phosphate phosphatase Spo0E family protein [Mesobacillus zeae]RID88297.1 aspartyl-phosphate phosphatase Spo0E family protein [Mesobacillus zeae]
MYTCNLALKNQIEALRSEMVSAGILYGFQHIKTINLSVELDILLNKFQKQ